MATKGRTTSKKPKSTRTTKGTSNWFTDAMSEANAAIVRSHKGTRKKK